MLFLDERDLLVKTARQIVGGEIGYIHIIIHRLLLCGGNDHGREHGLQIGYFGIDTAADVVFGKAMMRDGRTTGHDLRITADKSFRLYALLHFQKVRIAV